VWHLSGFTGKFSESKARRYNDHMKAVFLSILLLLTSASVQANPDPLLDGWWQYKSGVYLKNIELNSELKQVSFRILWDMTEFTYMWEYPWEEPADPVEHKQYQCDGNGKPIKERTFGDVIWHEIPDRGITSLVGMWLCKKLIATSTNEQEKSLEEEERAMELESPQQVDEIPFKRHVEESRVEALKKIKPYVHEIRFKVLEKWVWPFDHEGLHVIYDVYLNHSGEVESIELNKSSGNRAYDYSVRAAIESASPLISNPIDAILFEEVLEDGLRIKFSF